MDVTAELEEACVSGEGQHEVQLSDAGKQGSTIQ